MGIFRSSSPRASAWAAPDLGVEAINPPLAPVRVAVPDGKGGVTLVRGAECGHPGVPTCGDRRGRCGRPRLPPGARHVSAQNLKKKNQPPFFFFQPFLT